MKKFWKFFLITLLSLFSILIITVSIVSWLVFTPERITPIVRKQAAKFLSCQSVIGEVDLTLFSTYPNFGLKVRDFALVNPVADAPSDTLVKVDELIGVLDADAWRKRKEVILVGLELTGGSISLYTDSLGNTNYDVVVTDTPEPDSEKNLPVIDIRRVVLKNVDLQYNDLSAKMSAVIHDLSAEITGAVRQDDISGKLNLATPGISLAYGGEKYLEQASLRLDVPVDAIPSRQFIHLKYARVSLNGLDLMLNGTLENDTIQREIRTDLDYQLSSWPVSRMMALVPPSLQTNLEGMDADGLLSSEGSIKGSMSDSVMPLMDIHLQLEEGKMNYDGFPIPLKNIESDIRFYSDLKTDSLSFVRINRFNASTPRSNVRIQGFVNHLFTDITCDLTTQHRLWRVCPILL